jgi:uncharacterized protein YjfI (DUF2170 family)
MKKKATATTVTETATTEEKEIQVVELDTDQVLLIILKRFEDIAKQLTHQSEQFDAILSKFPVKESIFEK